MLHLSQRWVTQGRHPRLNDDHFSSDSSAPKRPVRQQGAPATLRAMTFTAYQIGKLVLFGVGALIWGIYCGLKGRDLSGRPVRRDRGPGERE